MTQANTGYVQVEDGQLYYETEGQGDTLVLSHALFLDSRMFDPIWPTLTRHYRVVRYDLRGFGKSSEAHGPAERRADLRQLLDQLDIPQAHWVGCSNSGQIMLDLALEAPERVKSLTLVGASPSGYEMTGPMPPDVEAMVTAMQQGDYALANALQIQIWLDGQYRTPEQLDPVLRKKALEMNLIPVTRGTFFTADWSPCNPLTPPAVTRLNEVACPTLIISGTLDHPAVREASDLLAAQIPGARKAVMEGCGHVPSYEQPEQFLALMTGFLHDVATHTASAQVAR